MGMDGSDEFLGRGYTKIRDIGHGSFGKAVLVQDGDGRQLVVKLIDTRSLNAKQRRDAVNEVKVLAILRHPFIVSYRDSFTDNRSLAIVMKGGDLNQRNVDARKACKTLPEVKILRWVTEAVFELKYMHEKHVIHRDSFSPRRKPRVGQQRHAQSDHPRPSRD